MKNNDEKSHIILFDLDGTLVDSTQAIYASFCAAFNAMQKPAPSLESVKNVIGHTLEDMFIACGVAHKAVSAYIKHYRICYRGLMEEGTHLLPLVKEALEMAHTFAYLGIVTTKRGDFSRILLDKLGVGAYFDVIVGIESIQHPKPHKEPILKAIEILTRKYNHIQNINKTYMYMIGDTRLDIESAINAQINAVGVLCGFGKEQDMKAYNVPLCANARDGVAYIAQTKDTN